MVSHNERLIVLAALSLFSLYNGIFGGHKLIQRLLQLQNETAEGSSSELVNLASTQYCSSRRIASESWIMGERHGNARNTGSLGREELLHLLLGRTDSTLRDESFQVIFSQTMSHPRSRFVNVSDRNVDDDLYRLMFLAIHHHQHKMAQEEAMDRLVRCHDTTWNLPDSIGVYDFECPKAKFIVTRFPSYGLGMSLKHTIADAILLGILTNRVVIVINSLNTTHPEVPQDFKSQWDLASCDRHDMQCVFLPLSPCVLTIEDLRNASHVAHADIAVLRKSGFLSSKYERSKVIILPTNDYPMPKPIAVLEQVQLILQSELLSKAPLPWGMTSEYLDQVFQALVPLEQNKVLPTIWQLEDAAVLYTLRLNVEYREKLQKLIATSFPSDFNPETAIGLAIRSSDKCLQESECLSFDNYTTIAHNIAQADTKQYLQAINSSSKELSTSNGLLYDTIVLTSESSMIIEARKVYENISSFPFRFVVNSADIMQGSGNPRHYKALQKVNISADDIMFSTVSSIAFQMMCKVVVANLCSNFHKIMIAFIHRGLSAVYNPNMTWLQENEVPEFRICCAWSNSEECKQRRQAGKFGANFNKGQDVGIPNAMP
jgi:hypothetical protein